MHDIELYRTILGLTPPWRVVSVELDVKGQQVVVQVDAGPGPFRCPECQTEVPGCDRKPRRWRDLDTCQFTTWIAGEIPRVACPTHGVKQIRILSPKPGQHLPNHVFSQHRLLRRSLGSRRKDYPSKSLLHGNSSSLPGEGEF